MKWTSISLMTALVSSTLLGGIVPPAQGDSTTHSPANPSANLSENSTTDSPSNPTVNPFAYRCPFLLKPLLTKILPDLPSYINRSIERQRKPGDRKPSDRWHYVLRFSAPDYRPMGLQIFSDRHPEFHLGSFLKTPGLYQVFLTSSERFDTDSESQTLEQFHWLIFQQNDRYQWQLVKIFSQDSSGNLRESHSEPIGQAIDQRLEECWLPRSP